MGCVLGRQKGAQVRRKLLGGSEVTGEMKEKPWWKLAAATKIGTEPKKNP